VGTTEDRTKAEEAVRRVAGVKAVYNQLEIAPDDLEDRVGADDSAVRTASRPP